MKGLNILNSLLIFIGMISVVALVLAIPIQLLWNHFLVGAIDGIHEIGLFQSFSIYILTTILFKSTVKNKKK